MKKEFVTYEIGEKLKLLGFNNPCMAMFQKNKKLWYTGKKEWLHNYTINPDPEILELYKNIYPHNVYTLPNGHIVLQESFNFTAPLWQQAIDFFREEYKLDITVKFPEAKDGKKHEGINSSYYDIEIKRISGGDVWNQYKFSQYSDDYYEARKKAIECAIEEVTIIKNIIV